MYVYIVAVVAIVVAMVVHYWRSYRQFALAGVRHPRPLPFLGCIGPIITGSQHLAEHMEYLYNKYPNDRFVGRYEFTLPTVLVRDLELARELTIKYADHFIDHRVYVDEECDSVFARNLVSLKGQEWKDMRAMLTPSFTSAKRRHMVPLMEEVGWQMMRKIQEQLKNSRTGYIDVECTDLTTRYTNDVIASCAFGLKVDSYVERNNEFFRMGQSIASFKLRAKLVFAAMQVCPSLIRTFKISMFSREAKDFFVNLFINTVKHREAHNIVRPDIIHLLMQEKESWADMDLVAQALMFFMAGFETVSTGITFALRELALHPTVQRRLVAELRDHQVAHAGRLDYTSIQKLPYLDMVVSEVLRLWPPIIATERTCVKDFNIGKAHKDAPGDYIVREGDSINIPIWSYHRDPQNFPDPLKFDPERFSEQKKHLIKPMSYIPFGMGPRNCLGIQFALCEMKMFLYQVLLEIEISPLDKTKAPVRLDRTSFFPALKGGHWVRFSSRNIDS